MPRTQAPSASVGPQGWDPHQPWPPMGTLSCPPAHPLRSPPTSPRSRPARASPPAPEPPSPFRSHRRVPRVTWCYCPHPGFAGHGSAPSQPPPQRGPRTPRPSVRPARLALAVPAAPPHRRPEPPARLRRFRVHQPPAAPGPDGVRLLEASAPLCTQRAHGTDAAFQGIRPQIVSPPRGWAMGNPQLGTIGDAGLSPSPSPRHGRAPRLLQNWAPCAPRGQCSALTHP